MSFVCIMWTVEVSERLAFFQLVIIEVMLRKGHDSG